MIRNAILGDKTYASTGYNASAIFGLNANTCSALSEAYSCLSYQRANDCVDADYGLGVLCIEYIAAATNQTVSLGEGGSPRIELVATSLSAPSPSHSSSAKDAVYFPDPVKEELTLRYFPISGQSGES